MTIEFHPYWPSMAFECTLAHVDTVDTPTLTVNGMGDDSREFEFLDRPLVDAFLSGGNQPGDRMLIYFSEDYKVAGFKNLDMDPRMMLERIRALEAKV